MARTTKCKYCGGLVARDINAKCPHCGAEGPEARKARILGSAFLVAVLVIGGVWVLLKFADNESSSRDRSSRIEARDRGYEREIYTALGGLRAEPDIEWLEVSKREVYIGFTERPPNLQQLCEAWALQASMKIDGERVHIWAVPAHYGPDWRPSSGSARDRIFGYFSASERYD